MKAKTTTHSLTPTCAGILVNRSKSSAPRLLKTLQVWLRRRGFRVVDSVSSSCEQVMLHSDFIICLGGDGTLLSLAPWMERRSVPVLGVNLGDLGFLTEIKQNEMLRELERFLAGKSKIEKRLMLSCEAASGKGTHKKFTALNDIVINREGLSRMIYVEVSVNGEKLTCFAGDGVVIATPTGSTAYSLSAGGAVVHPSLNTILITPICPHASALRSMVVSSDQEIEVRLRKKGETCRALLTADGQKNLELNDRSLVRVTRAPLPLQLIKSSKRGYFETLREIFKFPV